MAGAGRTPINVTPLIDVVLVLLIIFMVITPMMDDDKGIEMPQVKTWESDDGEMDERITIVIGSEGRLYLRGAPVAMEQLGAAVAALQSTSTTGELKVRVKGDKNLEAQAVLPVLSALNEIGVRHIALGVEEIP